MSIWDDAGAIIDAAFEEPNPAIYTGAGLNGDPVPVIRSDEPAPTFEGPGGTLRTITYEVKQSDLPQEPRKSNTFTHRGRAWGVEDITRRDDIGKWLLIVVDTGPAQ